MWTVSRSPDPSIPTDGRDSDIVRASCDVGLVVFENNVKRVDAFKEGGRTAKVALADLTARILASILFQNNNGTGARSDLEMLDQAYTNSTTTERRKRAVTPVTPFVMERSDIYCSGHELNITLRGRGGIKTETLKSFLATDLLPKLRSDAPSHIVCMVLQDRLRSSLTESDAVAFLCDGSVLPRRSGADFRPMPPDQAVRLRAPDTLRKTLRVTMGKGLSEWLPPYDDCLDVTLEDKSVVAVTGLLIPCGVTLLVGGGFHGKSTLLRAIGAGVCNKIPGDGREYCVTRHSAVCVRAEDGRYVDSCDIRPFLNLETLPGRRSSSESHTEQFSTTEASGSTSQAANVVEAIESGATALLLDEDVSAANFLARDGRMRALIVDETITPLLYRANGLFNKQQPACIYGHRGGRRRGLARCAAAHRHSARQLRNQGRIS